MTEKHALSLLGSEPVSMQAAAPISNGDSLQQICRNKSLQQIIEAISCAINALLPEPLKAEYDRVWSGGYRRFMIDLTYSHFVLSSHLGNDANCSEGHHGRQFMNSKPSRHGPCCRS